MSLDHNAVRPIVYYKRLSHMMTYKLLELLSRYETLKRVPAMRLMASPKQSDQVQFATIRDVSKPSRIEHGSG